MSERYVPEYPSQVQTEWTYRELQRLGDSLDTTDKAQLDVTHVAPEKPREGNIRFADGTQWNPGSGRGLYFYDDEWRSTKDTISVADFDGDIQAAIDYAESLGNTEGLRIYIPSGEYLISAALTITTNGIGLEGDGPGSTIIRATAVGFNFIEFNGGTSGDAQRDNFIKNLQLRYDGDHTGGYGVLVQNCIRPVIQDVMFWQLHGGVSMDRSVVGTYENLYYEKGSRSVKGDAFFSITSSTTQSGKSSGNHLRNCEVNGGNGLNGGGFLDYMFYVESSDGLYIDQCHGSGVEYQMYFAPNGTANGEVLDVFMNNCYFDTALNTNVRFTGSSLTGGYQGFYFNNCLIRNSSNDGILFSSTAKNVMVNGGQIRLANGSGIKAAAASIDGLFVNGTLFTDNNGGANAADGDIDVQIDHGTIQGTAHRDGDAAGFAIRIRNGSTKYSVIYPEMKDSTAGDLFVDDADANDSVVVGAHRNTAALASFGREQRTKQTTNASATQIWSYTLSDDESMTVEALVHCASDTVATAASYKVFGGAHKDGASAAALIGTTSQTHVGETDAGMDCTLALNGNALELQITGLAATNISWGAEVAWVKRQD